MKSSGLMETNSKVATKSNNYDLEMVVIAVAIISITVAAIAIARRPKK